MSIPSHSYVAQRCHVCGRITGGCIQYPVPPVYPPYPGLGNGCSACRGGGPAYPPYIRPF